MYTGKIGLTLRQQNLQTSQLSLFESSSDYECDIESMRIIAHAIKIIIWQLNLYYVFIDLRMKVYTI